MTDSAPSAEGSGKNRRRWSSTSIAAVVAGLSTAGASLVLWTSECQPPNHAAPTIEHSPQMTDLSQLRQAAQRRVLFTHMSVGSNLLRGLGSILSESEVQWRIVSPDQSDHGPAVIEATPGGNGDPRSKMDGFAELLRATNPPPDLAMMKLCYADITETTAIDPLFAHYEETIRALRQEFPAIVIGHVTVPLSVRPVTAKARISRVVGRRVWEDASNAKRAEYNARLRATFGGDPIFDLAGIESTHPDGKLEVHEVRGISVPALVRRYASDEAGHLNDLGQRIVAQSFVAFVAGVTVQGSEIH